MTSSLPTRREAREVCEALLRADRDSNIEKSILSSEVAVVNRMLSRGLELEDAYDELHNKLGKRPHALEAFFSLLLSTAAFWDPESNRESRAGRARLVQVNEDIAKVAKTLAGLLEERTELKNHSGFSCDTLYHPIEAIHLAAERNYSYEHWVKGKLEALAGQFDLKYWPSLSAVVDAIAEDAARAVPVAHDPVTEAGTEGPRASRADTFRAFFVALDEQKQRGFGYLPNSFELTDRSVATLLSCALDFGEGETVDAQYVKRLRQRARERESSS
jgi:hypothetical protein